MAATKLAERKGFEPTVQSFSVARSSQSRMRVTRRRQGLGQIIRFGTYKIWRKAIHFSTDKLLLRKLSSFRTNKLMVNDIHLGQGSCRASSVNCLAMSNYLAQN
jgi:hypothetical protein